MHNRHSYLILTCLLWNISCSVSISTTKNFQGMVSSYTLLLDFSPTMLTMTEGLQALVTLSFRENGTVEDFIKLPWMLHEGRVTVESDIPFNLIIVNSTNAFNVTPCDFLMGKNHTVTLKASSLGYAKLMVYWEPQGQPGIFNISQCSRMVQQKLNYLTTWSPDWTENDERLEGAPTLKQIFLSPEPSGQLESGNHKEEIDQEDIPAIGNENELEEAPMQENKVKLENVLEKENDNVPEDIPEQLSKGNEEESEEMYVPENKEMSEVAAEKGNDTIPENVLDKDNEDKVEEAPLQENIEEPENVLENEMDKVLENVPENETEEEPGVLPEKGEGQNELLNKGNYIDSEEMHEQENKEPEEVAEKENDKEPQKVLDKGYEEEPTELSDKGNDEESEEVSRTENKEKSKEVSEKGDKKELENILDKDNEEEIKVKPEKEDKEEPEYELENGNTEHPENENERPEEVPHQSNEVETDKVPEKKNEEKPDNKENVAEKVNEKESEEVDDVDEEKSKNVEIEVQMPGNNTEHEEGSTETTIAMKITTAETSRTTKLEESTNQSGSESSDFQNNVPAKQGSFTAASVVDATITETFKSTTTTMKKNRNNNKPNVSANYTNSDSSISMLLEEHVAQPEQTTISSSTQVQITKITRMHEEIWQKPPQPNKNRVSNIYDQGVTFLFRRLQNLTIEQLEPIDAQILLSDKFQVRILRDEGSLDTVFIILMTLLILFNTLMLGFEMELSAMRKILKKPIGLAVGFFCQFVFMPIASYILSLLLLSDPCQRLGLFTLGCSYGGRVNNFWTLLLNGDINLSMTMTAISTACTLFMMPLWLYTLGQTLLEDVSIGIPFTNLIFSLFSFTTSVIIGMSIRRCKPHWADLVKKCIRPFTMVLIIVLIVLSIWNLQYIFRLMTWQLLVAGFCIACSGFLFGAFSAWIFCQTWAQIVAISIATVIQSPRITFVVLHMTLQQPESDISVVAPVVQILLTTIPLILTFLAITIYRRLISQKCRKGKDEEKCQQDVIKNEANTTDPLLINGTVSTMSSPLKEQANDFQNIDPAQNMELHINSNLDNTTLKNLEKSTFNIPQSKNKKSHDMVHQEISDLNQNLNSKNGFAILHESVV